MEWILSRLLLNDSSTSISRDVPLSFILSLSLPPSMSEEAVCVSPQRQPVVCGQLLRAQLQVIISSYCTLTPESFFCFLSFKCHQHTVKAQIYVPSSSSLSSRPTQPAVSTSLLGCLTHFKLNMSHMLPLSLYLTHPALCSLLVFSISHDINTGVALNIVLSPCPVH